MVTATLAPSSVHQLCLGQERNNAAQILGGGLGVVNFIDTQPVLHPRRWRLQALYLETMDPTISA